MQNYDIAVIGGGAGGLVVASVAAQLGLNVALAEKQKRLGGDCLHYGCVPSKSLLRCAHVAHTVRHAGDYGVDVGEASIGMQQVNAYINNAVQIIQQHDSHERFREMGCEIYTGGARFINAHCIRVDDTELQAKRFVIATGSSAWIPDIEGIQSVDYLTNEDMFSLETRPEHLLVLGAGPVGVEMAQAYARLGSRVSLIEQAQRILPRFDRDISRQLKKQLLEDGVDIVHGAVERVQQQGDVRTLVLKDERRLTGDQLLVAVGRRPVIEGLSLENAGVEFSESGIKVNARMQTSRRHIYACGDVTGLMPFTHVAEQQAGVVIANAVFRIPKRMHYRVIPAVVYTEPDNETIRIVSLRKALSYERKQYEKSIKNRLGKS